MVYCLLALSLPLYFLVYVTAFPLKKKPVPVLGAKIHIYLSAANSSSQGI